MPITIAIYTDCMLFCRTVTGRRCSDEVKNDFALEIVAFVEAGSNTGYLVKVKREHDSKVR